MPVNTLTFADARKALNENLATLQEIRQTKSGPNVDLVTNFTQALLAMTDATEHELRAIRAQLNVIAQRR